MILISAEPKRRLRYAVSRVATSAGSSKKLTKVISTASASMQSGLRLYWNKSTAGLTKEPGSLSVFTATGHATGRHWIRISELNRIWQNSYPKHIHAASG